MEIQRICLLKVPVDIVRTEQLEDVILSLINKPGTKQIILLSLWDLLRTKVNSEYRQCVLNADLVLPVSKSLISGARFLKLAQPIRYNPFNFIISVLGILDSHYKTLYMFGGRKASLMQAERNVRSTFAGIHPVGRYAGYFPKSAEKDIITAIYKASPSLVLMSVGVKDDVCWVYRQRNRFSSSVFLWDKDVFDIFSSRKKRISASLFERGMEIWPELLRNPFKLFLFFPYLWYLLCLLATRLFFTPSLKKRNKKDNV